MERQKTKKGLGIIPFDITLDGKRKGQWFDFIYRTDTENDGQ